MKSAERRQVDFNEKQKALTESKDLDFDRLPENSKRAYYREFKKVLEAADVILEVLDARDPIGTRTTSVEQMIAAQNKKVILVLNKIDLVPREIAQGWLKYLRNEHPTIAFKCTTSQQRMHLSQSKVSAANATSSALQSTESIGAQTLIQLIKNYSRSEDIKTSITVGIIGYPNVGKSSLINSLNRSKAVGVGSTPGFTKVMQEVQLDKKVKLLDCPGIVFASGSEQDIGDIMLRNCVRVEKIEDPIKPIEAILKRCKPMQLVVKYKIPAFETSQEFLASIARRRGKLRKGGIPDYVDAARIVLQDWNSGALPYFTIPPQSASTDNTQFESAKIVNEFSKEFDLAALLQEADQASVSSLPSIVSTTEDSYLQLEPGVSLDSLFSSMLTLSDETKNEESEDEEDMSDDDDDEAQEDSDEETMDMDFEEAPTPKNQTAVPQKLYDPEDEFNPRTNLQIKKQLKKQRKKARKQRQVPDAPFDFNTDFVADNEVDDEDLLDL